MKTIYLHIGKPKTGTTAIQEFLTVNHSLLKERNFFYPCDNERSYVHMHQHVPLVLSISKVDVWVVTTAKSDFSEQLFVDLKEDIENSNCDNIILSSEFFSDVLSFNEDNIRTLKERFVQYFPEYSVKIIIYIRRPDEAFLSMTSQGFTTGFKGEVSLDAAFKSKYFVTSDLLEVYAEKFGKENITIRLFDRKQFINSDLISDFLNILGLEKDEKYLETELANEGLSLLEMNFFEKFNRFTEHIRYSDIHQKLREYIRKSGIFAKGKIKDGLLDEDKQKIVDYHREEYKNIEEFFNLDKSIFDFKVSPTVELDHYKYKVQNETFIKMLIELIEDLYLKNEQNEKNPINFIKNSDKFENKLEDDIKFLMDNNFFDVENYLTKYPDVREAGIDPIRHYLQWGWREDREPVEGYKTYDYVLENFVELIEQDSNPFVHYCINKNK